MSDEKPIMLLKWVDGGGVEHYAPATIAARLRGMAANPHNAADMRLLVAAAEMIDRDSDAPAMLDLLRELEFAGLPDGHPACPYCHARPWTAHYYCPLGALLDKHGRG